MSEKPRLYHGSTNRNIETFEPRVSKGSGEEDGPVVFASPVGRGLSDKEWKSAMPVKPESKEDFPSALEAMISHDVQVFFVTKEQFASMRASDDQGRALLRTIESENGRRGTNIKTF